MRGAEMYGKQRDPIARPFLLRKTGMCRAALKRKDTT
jgi:hypothetical protein